MLRSELYELERSVDAIINTNRITGANDSQALLVDRVKRIGELCADLKKKWTHELFSNAKDVVIKRYVQYHQAGIVQLSDRLMAGNLRPDHGRETIFGQLVNELESVLDFLREKFYPYFDIDHKATFVNGQTLISDAIQFKTQIGNYNGNNVDQKLLSAVLLSVKEIAEEAAFSGVSYRQAIQCTNIMRMVIHLLSDAGASTERLFTALYRQNFNSLHIHHWYQEHILKEIAGIADKKGKEQWIKEQLDKLSGIYVDPGKAIQADLPSTDRYLLPLLQEQLASGSKRILRQRPGQQFALNLSVPQFAIFIRIFSKTGCFPVTNVALISRFFSEHFTTKKQPNISPKSFGRAFYNIDQPAAAVVRDFLQKMINYLNKTYFP